MRMRGVHCHCPAFLWPKLTGTWDLPFRQPEELKGFSPGEGSGWLPKKVQFFLPVSMPTTASRQLGTIPIDFPIGITAYEVFEKVKRVEILTLFDGRYEHD
jgi:hypothetical protein